MNLFRSVALNLLLLATAFAHAARTDGASSGGGGLAKPSGKQYKLLDFDSFEGVREISPSEILRCNDPYKNKISTSIPSDQNETPIYGCLDPLLKKIGQALPNFETTLREYLKLKHWWLDPNPLSKEGCESEFWIATQNGLVLAACQRALDVRISSEVYFGFVNDLHRTGLWSHEILQAHRLAAIPSQSEGSPECSYENLMAANNYLHTNSFDTPKAVQDEFRKRGFFKWATSEEIHNMNNYFNAVKTRVCKNVGMSRTSVWKILNEESENINWPIPFPGFSSFQNYFTKMIAFTQDKQTVAKDLRNFCKNYQLNERQMDWSAYERQDLGYRNE